MSDQEPEEPYVFQPYGVFTSSTNRVGSERFYGVAGVSYLTDIKGLTKAEAEAVCETLKKLRGKNNDSLESKDS